MLSACVALLSTFMKQHGYGVLTRLQFPEVKFPGRFDLVGHSHQIMHVAVLIAGLVHYHGLSQAFLETRGGEMRICRTNTGTESRVS